MIVLSVQVRLHGGGQQEQDLPGRGAVERPPARVQGDQLWAPG